MEIKGCVDKTMNSFGAIHFAINCAGVATPAKVLSKKGPIAIDQFNQVIQINLVGTMIMIKLAAEKMIANTPNDDGEKGVVINTASAAAYDGQIGQAAYSASKSAGTFSPTVGKPSEFAQMAKHIIENPVLNGETIRIDPPIRMEAR